MASSSSFPQPRSLVLPLTAVIFFFLVNSSFVLCDQQTQDLISQICQDLFLPRSDYDFCVKTFNDNLKSPSTDIHGLTEIALQTTFSSSTDTSGYIGLLLQNATGPLKLALSTCEVSYNTVVRSFKLASDDLNQGDYAGVLKQAEAVGPQTSTMESCSGGFQGIENPLAERNKNITIFIAMSISSAHLLAKT